MSLKDDWKDTGKGMGKSFEGLGKSILKSVKVGIDRVVDDENDQTSSKDTDLRKAWSEVGHSFEKTGTSLGKAASGTMKKAAGKIDSVVEDQPQETKTEE